jgi:hypothetical protein
MQDEYCDMTLTAAEILPPSENTRHVILVSIIQALICIGHRDTVSVFLRHS